MPTTLSAQNPRVAAARELLTPRGRRSQGRFAFEGPTLLAEAIAARLAIDELFVTPAAYAANELLRSVDPTRLALVSEATMARISDLTTPSGIVAIAARHLTTIETLLADEAPLLLLAGLNDPGNVGTLLRSAEAFGIGGVVLLSGGVDPYHPKVVRAAMGALFRLPIAVVDAAEFTARLGTVSPTRPFITATKEGRPLPSFSFPPRCIVGIGHERHGFTAGLPAADAEVGIPQHGAAESLNAAIAGSILCYALSIDEERRRSASPESLR